MKKLYIILLMSVVVSCGQTAQARLERIEDPIVEEITPSIQVLPLPEDSNIPISDYGYLFPDPDYESGDLPMGMPYEPYDFEREHE